MNITVYERSDYVGGRSTTVNVYGDPLEPVELGASIFVQVNRNLVNAVNEFSLSTRGDNGAHPDDPPQILGIWNGKEFVFTQNDDDSDWLSAAKIIWKYGILNVWRTQSLMKKTVGTFLRMYEKPVFPFRSLSETAYELGLNLITARTGSKFLEDNGIQPPFSTDIIQASTRVNYAQNLNQIHGLETMVCMAIQGQMSVVGGNWQIFDQMIKASGATALLNTSVAEISHQRDGIYTVKAATSAPEESLLEPASNHPQVNTYDSVIIATPLQFSNITFAPALKKHPLPIPYVTLYVTLFASPHSLSPSAFNLPTSSPAPSIILTTQPTDPVTKLPFFSISTLRSILNPTNNPSRRENLYKIFSPAPLPSSFLSHILGLPTATSDAEDSNNEEVETDTTINLSKEDISWIYRKKWHSYPYLHPRVTFDDPQLDQAGTLWYTSGIEQFISTMETSSLMGMNVAKLAVDAWEESNDGNGGPEQGPPSPPVRRPHDAKGGVGEREGL